jgi:predicted metal-binding membrane protein
MAQTVVRWRVPPVVLATIGGAWALALWVHASGRAHTLHHDWLIDGGLPLVAGLVVFLLAWQVHLAAMMLPSSLPMIALFSQASASQRAPTRARLAFLGGYAAVWTGFGAIAFLGDVALHRLVHGWTWLGQRPWLITGSVLIIAGAFQFTEVKDRCLQQCRHPGAFLLRHYERGAAGAFRMGRRHGSFCLGCCWALMLLMFAVGVANLVWMAPLALVMFVEKTSRRGADVTTAVGLSLLAVGGLVLVHPSWLPMTLTAS